MFQMWGEFPLTELPDQVEFCGLEVSLYGVAIFFLLNCFKSKKVWPVLGRVGEISIEMEISYLLLTSMWSTV